MINDDLREGRVRHAIIGIIIGIIAGIIIGATVVRPEITPQHPVSGLPETPEKTSVTTISAPPSQGVVLKTPHQASEDSSKKAEPETVLWRMSSVYAGALPVLGELPAHLEKTLALLSGGKFKIQFHEPGTLVPPQDLFDAVRSGTIQAGFSSPALWADKNPALQLFSSVPFGPGAREYLAWFYQGGGQEIFEDIYSKFNIYSLPCAATSQEASGWFKKPVLKTSELAGLRMRISGLGGKVMEELGVITEFLMNEDIIVALKSGAIDAAEFSQPATDYALGIHRVANTVYFPGWHQPATLFDLMINRDAWNDLSDTTRAQIKTACGDNVRRGLTLSDARQFITLKLFTVSGIDIRTWPDELMLDFKNAWEAVVLKQVKENKDFKRTWLSLQKFREEYAIWQELSVP